MHRMFDVWVEREVDKQGRQTVYRSFWIQSRRIGPETSPGQLQGVAVRPLMSGIEYGSPAYQIWLAYAIRTAYAWNCILLAAELLDMPRDTPPFCLADLCWEAGQHHLATELQELFGCGPLARDDGQQGPVTYPPPGPSETGELGCVVI